MAHHVRGAQMHERDVVDASEHAFDCGQSRPGRGQVDLGDVAGHHHLRVESQSRQEHLHLLRGRVLRFVEDHIRVVERAAAHVGERRHFDCAVVEQRAHALRTEHVGQGVVQGAQIRVHLLVERTGQESEVLSRFHGGTCQDDAPHLAFLERAHGLGHRQVGLAGAGRADAERDGVLVDRLHIARLPQGLGTHRIPGGIGDHAGRMRFAVGAARVTGIVAAQGARPAHLVGCRAMARGLVAHRVR